MASNDDSTIFEKYKEFVKSNPLVASELEVSLRWISYFAAGRFSQSPVVSELMYSASSLLSLLNDTILRRAADIPVHLNTAVEKMQTTLSVLEYVEVFAELAARRLGGETKRWVVIVILQMVKCVFRLILVLKYKQGIQKSPPIAPLNRRRDVPHLCYPNYKVIPLSSDPSASGVDVTFTLKRSGRSVRSLDAAPPLSGRTWKVPLPQASDGKEKVNLPPTPLTQEQLGAEILHVTRPLLHLAAMKTFGQHSWKPWILALGMDFTSLQLLSDHRRMTYGERIEMSRRALVFLLFLLRSPFYDRFSKFRIMRTLQILADNVPVVGILIRPLMEYIPEWQSTYFYTWAL